MGRMKEVYTELQNKYGEDLENLPKDFSMENYINNYLNETKYSEEMEKMSDDFDSYERWRKQLSPEEFKAKFPYYDK